MASRPGKPLSRGFFTGSLYPRALPALFFAGGLTAGLTGEVVAAAILENARGDVVGDKTFGDGSVQETIDLKDGGALILSVAKYYSPGGKAIQDTGVTPNVAETQTDADAGGADFDDDSAADETFPDKPSADTMMRRAILTIKQ